MSASTEPTIKGRKLDDVRDIARAYFEARESVERLRDELTAFSLEANDLGGATQQEIADVCDLSHERPNGARTEWRLHRTRIQQLIREGRGG